MLPPKNERVSREDEKISSDERVTISQDAEEQDHSLEPSYIYELEVLRAMLGQEDRQGTSAGVGRGRRNATKA